MRAGRLQRPGVEPDRRHCRARRAARPGTPAMESTGRVGHNYVGHGYTRHIGPSGYTCHVITAMWAITIQAMVTRAISACPGTSAVRAYADLMLYRADWEPAAASGGRTGGVLGVFWGSPTGLWGSSTPNQARVSVKKTPLF